MNSKTLLLALVVFSVAAYLVYQLEKKRMMEDYSWNSSPNDSSSGSDPSQNNPAQPSSSSGGSDQSGQDPFVLTEHQMLCSLAPSLCKHWSIPMPIIPPKFTDPVHHTPLHVYREPQIDTGYI